MLNICHACGRPLEDAVPWQGWVVDLTRNLATANGVQLKLHPQHAEFLHLLLLQRGRGVTSEFLIDRLWGVHGGMPKDPNNSLQAIAAPLRAIVRPFGLRIANHYRRWSLEIPDSRTMAA